MKEIVSILDKEKLQLYPESAARILVELAIKVEEGETKNKQSQLPRGRFLQNLMNGQIEAGTGNDAFDTLMKLLEGMLFLQNRNVKVLQKIAEYVDSYSVEKRVKNSKYVKMITQFFNEAIENRLEFNQMKEHSGNKIRRISTSPVSVGNFDTQADGALNEKLEQIVESIHSIQEYEDVQNIKMQDMEAHLDEVMKDCQRLSDKTGRAEDTALPHSNVDNGDLADLKEYCTTSLNQVEEYLEIQHVNIDNIREMQDLFSSALEEIREKTNNANEEMQGVKDMQILIKHVVEEMKEGHDASRLDIDTVQSIQEKVIRDMITIKDEHTEVLECVSEIKESGDLAEQQLLALEEKNQSLDETLQKLSQSKEQFDQEMDDLKNFQSSFNDEVVSIKNKCDAIDNKIMKVKSLMQEENEANFVDFGSEMDNKVKKLQDKFQQSQDKVQKDLSHVLGQSSDLSDRASGLEQMVTNIERGFERQLTDLENSLQEARHNNSTLQNQVKTQIEELQKSNEELQKRQEEMDAVSKDFKKLKSSSSRFQVYMTLLLLVVIGAVVYMFLGPDGMALF